MISWKEKVAEKLARLLADSPSSHSHVDRDSPVVQPEPQAMPLLADELPCPETSLSSILLSLLPATPSSTDGQKSNNPGNQHGFRPVPLRSLSTRWNNKSFTWKGRPVEQNAECGLESDSNEVIDISKEIAKPVSERNADCYEVIEEASTCRLEKFPPDLMDESAFISSHLFEFLQSSLPNLVKGCQWVLLYSTMKHGISLHTLLRNSVDLPGPGVLIAGDTKGAVFGCLLDCPLKPTAKRKYQGTNQAFVFTTIYGEPRLFRATGANRYYCLCLNDLLAFGGGGSFALCLDEDLLRGTSGPCETFGNLCLAHSQEFELKDVELWGFTHSSRYLS